MSLETVEINEFPIQDIPRSCSWVVIGPPGSGKSNFVEYLVYANKHKYPVGRAWCGTEDTQGKYTKFMHPLFVTNEYNQTEHEKVVARQKQSRTEKCQNPAAVCVMDDCGDDPKVFRSKVMKAQFKNGSQWYDELFVLANQYAIDLPPDIRKSISYVALFREPSPIEREKLWKNFSPGIPRAEFDDLLNALTGDFTCLVLKMRNQSNELKDCAFYFKAPDMKDKKWKMGCKEYHNWGEKRYNKKYVEKFI